MALKSTADTHAAQLEPSVWVQRWAAQVPAGGTVLDVACGGGRHARFFAARGHPVAGITALRADIECGPWPYAGRQFAAVVVTNYLHRPLFPALLAALAPGGVLIYETFALGNEVYGRPANPDFLLQRGELLRVAAGTRILAFEDIHVEHPRSAVVQRICARLADRSTA
jgi:SAM-dependent methyltransferase